MRGLEVLIPGKGIEENKTTLCTSHIRWPGPHCSVFSVDKAHPLPTAGLCPDQLVLQDNLSLNDVHTITDSKLGF